MCQGCLEIIDIYDDGTIKQVEMTSIGELLWCARMQPYSKTRVCRAILLKGIKHHICNVVVMIY